MHHINNKFYMPLVTLLCIFTYLLNFFNKISQCSLVFVFLTLTVNIISELYGKKKAMIAVVLSTIVIFGLLWNLDYYINGCVIKGVASATFVSVLLSTYCSTSVFLHLKSALTYSFNNRNFISLIVCAIIDGIVMLGFFINIFPATRVLSIFYQEVLFKCVYSLAAYICIFAGLYLAHKVHNNKINEGKK
ncbi:VUT family protein [Rickettsia endosymbiont of Oedothorax gibbosus]|uniref:VUT family protein n=1 Tax=Rickettsia endosymbiont of Oedothorax gibbosus TaxID=931099 RepID=UPI002024A9C9|nr:VUT family protein [Rickettsia endosymbiont of Oedothorax gibbosus]